MAKGNKTALAFEPFWEDMVNDLEKHDLQRTVTELLQAYCRKSGKALGQKI